MNHLRDEARAIANELGLEREFTKLESLIGTLLGTRDGPMDSSVRKARQGGRSYDPDRLDLFLKLFENLKRTAPTRRSAGTMNATTKANLAFYESYFSNFIEGTEFEVDEAFDIVFNGQIPQERPEDAHDVLGTFRIVSDDTTMAKLPKNSGEFIKLLKSRHAILMAMRKDKNPGQFKAKRNQAGMTHFVDPALVEGTLARGFEIYQGLSIPMHRAIFMMFMISEVHPFTDGNGRISRIMMNANLVAAEEHKIIIPTIYRNNYLASLKALTHNNLTEPLIRTLDFAQKYTQSISWNDLHEARRQLTETNAFMDSVQADEQGVFLKIR